MKDQYFGDINDYRKYGLLRAISTATNWRTLVAWMLTPDDGSNDGKFISYLNQPEKWRYFDPELYGGLKFLAAKFPKRQVGLIETSGLLPQTTFLSNHVPDSRVLRDSWFRTLLVQCHDAEFVFLDPDNGIEVKSKPYGTKNSSKYVFWNEVSNLWQLDKSLLIYQHFIREKRERFLARMLDQLSINSPGSSVTAFSTPHVAFLLALQPTHRHLLESISDAVHERWHGQISRAQQLAR